MCPMLDDAYWCYWSTSMSTLQSLHLLHVLIIAGWDPAFLPALYLACDFIFLGSCAF